MQLTLNAPSHLYPQLLDDATRLEFERELTAALDIGLRRQMEAVIAKARGE